MRKIICGENKKFNQLRRDNYQVMMTKEHEVVIAEIEMSATSIKMESDMYLKTIRAR